MDLDSFERDVKKKICEEIEVFFEGENRLVIVSPFTFDDGDSLNTVLKKKDNNWYFTDEGSTLMHLSYTDQDNSIDKGKRKEMFDLILSTHDMKNDGGELRYFVEDNDFGEAYFTFLQGLIKVLDIISFTKRDYVKSLFYEEFIEYLKEKFGDRCIFDYKNKENDPEGKYQVDCTIESEIPLFFFGLSNDAKCRDVTITCHMFREWGIKYTSVAIFENQEEINRKVLSRLTDVVDKHYSTLSAAKDGLPEYMKKFPISIN